MTEIYNKKPEPSALKISCLYFGHRITIGNELSDTFRSDYQCTYHSPALHTSSSWNKSHNEGVRNLTGNRMHYSTSQCCILIQLKLKITNLINRITWDKPSEDTEGYSWVPVSLYTCINGTFTGEKGVGFLGLFFQFVIIYRKFTILGLTLTGSHSHLLLKIIHCPVYETQSS